ncbi:MAG TPA: inositol monophosphatase family protein, partial [Acidimicrobiales bacterium]|nr:inositol monophosphatase family protein [Acidimicrobiales bacterium]
MSSGLGGSMPNAASSSNTSAGRAEMLDQHLRRLAALMLDALHATLSHRDRLEVTVKTSPHDLVSDADRSIERLIFDFTRAVFPEDGFLGEEGGWANRSMDGRNWVVDPVDGTMN